MNHRPLGRSGLSVAPLALGGNVFGWTVDERTSFALLDHFVDAGFNLIDTADVYSRWISGHHGGESETIIGKWLKSSGKRNKVVIATKVGMDMGSSGKGLSRAHIAQSVEASLKRLQTTSIDLYQSHADDASAPFEETLGAYGDLIKQGKIKAIGASNYDAKRLAAALEASAKHDLPRYETLQPHYNLVERAGFEKELQPLCQKEGLGVISYFSLASGFLTGKYRSDADLTKSARGQSAKKYMNDRGRRVLKALDEVAEELRSTPARVSLAWLMARPTIAAPIASATSLDQPDDVMAAAKLTLNAKAIDRLDVASA